ncbi:MAG: ATP-binding protein, partial [Verrucomicrobia bacterium]|nr:ATP-binding protein [Verrucomicrobiota bacterium]
RGNRIWVQMIAYPANPADPHSGVWWLLQDRSEVMRAQRELVNNYRDIKQANERLEEAQSQLLQSEKMASIGQLAAGVAHEINNPVGFVSSNLGSLRRYVEPLLALVSLYGKLDLSSQPAEFSKQIRQLQEQADLEFIHEDLPQLLKESDEGLGRVKKIVQDLKDFSRVDQSDWQEADLNLGLESTLNVVRHEIKYKAEVSKDFGELPLVRCLAGQLNQVFMNLIVNAAHAINQRGEIRLRTLHADDFVCVEVSDNGCGMSPEIQARIFEPFFTTKEVGKGTGLGLATVYGIVKQHEGWVEVTSDIGKGTTFHVFYPAAACLIETDPDSPAAALATPARGGKETILIVEDEPVLLDLAQLILKEQGYTILTARSGVEAVQVWQREHAHIDLLLTDMVMPEGMSGKDLAARLRQQRRELKVVYVSGYSVDEVDEKDIVFLQKPYTRASLAKTVRDCLDS